MDWLTEEWVSAEFTKALDSWVKKWHQCGIEQYVGTWFAKAAARKVVEWVEEHSTVEDDNPNCRLVLLGRTHVRCIREESDWQALRQEVGL